MKVGDGFRFSGRKSKISGVKATPHTLRHTHIVHSLLNKVPITAIQKQVGHKRLTTTQIYSDFAPEQIREAYEEVEKSRNFLK